MTAASIGEWGVYLERMIAWKLALAADRNNREMGWKNIFPLFSSFTFQLHTPICGRVLNLYCEVHLPIPYSHMQQSMEFVM